MVPEPSSQATIAGHTVVFGAHGDRVPPGSDAALRRGLRRAPRIAAKLATTWCGTARSTDDTANSSSTGARIKVVYAYPSDGVDRFAAYSNLIQADLLTVSDWVAATAAGSKTIRFDTGTDCGTDYLDIATVRLPRVRAEYVGTADRAPLVAGDVQEALGRIPWSANVLVYADTLYADDGVTGTAYMPFDDRHGAVNESNYGGGTAIVWGDGGPTFGIDRVSTALHEISHNLGAVQDSAPNSTLAGHCFDVFDVMCYEDGGPRNDMVLRCAPGSPLDPYDCGGDDYFNASPAPGSYLATHWNVYDSAFLCDPASCIQSAGSPTPTPTPTPTPPAPEPVPGDVAPDAAAWLDGFMKTASAKVKKAGLRGLARGKTVAIPGQAPAGHAVQLDLLWGASAIAGGSLDAGGVLRVKVARVHRALLSRKTKVRLTLQGVIRSAAGGGPPQVRRTSVTLKAPAKKKKRKTRR
jgi:hypothetical protein